MAFAQWARTIRFSLLPPWANYIPFIRFSPQCLRSLAFVISYCLCCPHIAWRFKVEGCRFLSMWAQWLRYSGAVVFRIHYFNFLGPLLKYKQNRMCGPVNWGFKWILSWPLAIQLKTKETHEEHGIQWLILHALRARWEFLGTVCCGLHRTCIDAAYYLIPALCSGTRWSCISL